jgi:hypothetical protein
MILIVDFCKHWDPNWDRLIKDWILIKINEYTDTYIIL